MDCKKVLIVEDDDNAAFLLYNIIKPITDAEIHISPTLEDALPKITWADLVITDYEYPTSGFSGLLPELQKNKKYFILQSGEIEYLKRYDEKLQIDAIYKGCGNFIHRIKKAIELAQIK